MYFISSLFRYTAQLLGLLVCFLIVLVANIFYYTELPLHQPRNYLHPISLAVCTLEFLLNWTKTWSLMFRFLSVLIVAFQVQQIINGELILERKIFLHQAYVLDFSYDKYCNLTYRDKMLLEEISIYGYTDCDDAKIPYKREDINTIHY